MSKIAKKNLLKRTVEAAEEDTIELVPAVDATHFDVEFAPGKRLVYLHFGGREFIHIREYGSMGGRLYPTKKGVCLTPSRLRALQERISTIDELLAQLEMNDAYGVTVGGEDPLYKQHLGGAIYASVSEKYQGVNLRRHFTPPAQNILIVPTKNGIYLPLTQWGALKTKLVELFTQFPKLKEAVECSMSHGGNQMETFDCRECTPFGYDVTD